MGALSLVSFISGLLLISSLSVYITRVFLYSLLDLVRYPHYFIDMKNKQDVLRDRQVAEFDQINNEG